MKNSLLKLRVFWRRMRRGPLGHAEQAMRIVDQAEALMQKANPFASWQERANWLADVAEWLRQGDDPVLDATQAERLNRLQLLLDWLDSHRDVRRVVQAALQKILREAVGPDLFCATGWSHEPAFFGELLGRLVSFVLPQPAQADLSGLLTGMFPRPSDANWLLELDANSLERVWRLCADDAISHAYCQQIDEALNYLVTMIVAVGVSSEFRQRLEPRMPLQATPFMALRRELEKYLLLSAHDDAALRSVRMLIAVCQAQTDRIYAHLDEHGVSVSLVYCVERMRAQLTRMSKLIDLRAAQSEGSIAPQAQALLSDLVDAHHHRSTVRGLARQSFSLLARKLVERNADHGEVYTVRDRAEYLHMLFSGCRAGVVLTLAVLGRIGVSGAGAARFFDGALASLGYAGTFFSISALSGSLASRQPAVTAPALAARMESLDTIEGLRRLSHELAGVARAQAATLVGNLLVIIPFVLLASILLPRAFDVPVMSLEQAQISVRNLSVIGPGTLFAAVTGILLWLSSLAGSFADNWFALRHMREALGHHRRLVRVLGPLRAQRCAAWFERHIAGIAGNLSLALLFGMTPVLATFFGLPFEVRHVSFAAGELAAAVGTLGGQSLASPDFWLAASGVVAAGVLNVAIALACALGLALRARMAPRRTRGLVYRAILRHAAKSPLVFLLPEKRGATANHLPPTPAAVPRRDTSKKTGGRAGG